MTLQWLGQGQAVLRAGHYYRARFLLPAPCPIPNTRLTQIKTLLNRLGSRTVSDWESWTVSKTVGPGWTVLKIPDPSYFNEFPPSPWPGNMREVPPTLNPNGMCPVWTWAKPKQDVTVAIDAVRGVLGTLDGVLLNFWDESSGQRIYDAPVTSFAPGQLSPGYALAPGGGGSPPAPSPTPTPTPTPSPTPSPPTTPPFFPPLFPVQPTTPTPGAPSPLPPTGTPEKKTSPAVYVVVGALAIGAIAVLMSRGS